MPVTASPKAGKKTAARAGTAKNAASKPHGGATSAAASGVRTGAPSLQLVSGAPVQLKVAIGEVNDPYEREADSVANSVVAGGDVPEVSSLSSAGLAGPPQRKAADEDAPPVQMLVQRQADEMVQEQSGDEAVQEQAGAPEEAVQAQAGEDESVQAQSGGGDEEVQALALQRQTGGDEPLQAQSDDDAVQAQSGDEEVQAQAGEDEAVQPSGAAAGAPRSAPRAAPASAPRRSPQVAAESAIHHSGPGTPLNRGTRSRLEGGMRTDLGGVRVHEDRSSHQANRDLGSRAFTHGSHIWLGKGESQNDLSLMAHETTHVLQQGAAVRRQPDEGGPSPAPSSAAPAAGPAAPPASESAAAPAAAAPAGPAPAAAPGAPGSASVQTVGEDEGPPPAPAPAPASGGSSGGGGDAAAGGSAGPAPAAEAAPGGEGASAGVDLQMPEPPSSLSPEEQARLDQVQDNAGEASDATTDLPGADESTEEARGAVDEPAEETAARAQNALVDALGERPEPSPEILELCDDIREAIRAKRPLDEEDLVNARPSEMAEQAGQSLNESVEGDVDRVGSEYDELQESPEGTPQQEGQPMEAPPTEADAPPLDATSANPQGVSEDGVDLSGDVENSQQQLSDAGLDSEVAEVIETGPVAEARGAVGELEEVAERDPAEVMAEQQAILANSQADMAALQEQAVAALASTRAETVAGSTQQQDMMVGSEADMRANLSQRAEEIFTGAQTQVDALLEPISRTAMSRWEGGVGVLSTTFEQHLKRVEDWLKERHSGGWGAVVSVWDDITGYPSWVTEEYNDAEQRFGDGVCTLITEISTEVNGVVAACEAIIADARTRITNLFTTDLPADLQAWAAEELAGFGNRLDGLSEQVSQTQQDFNQELRGAATSAVREVQNRVAALREAARGIVGRLADALAAFAEDPAKFILEGLLELVGIDPGAFWALVDKIGEVISDIADDPLGFANNLATALAEGFGLFFDGIGGHLLQGLLDWLFSGLGSVGVTIPSDFSLKSIITFFLELMGITWPRIRALLAEEIGEENVALIEKAYELVSTLIEQGPQGIFDMLADFLNPQTILDQVLQAAIDFMIEALITQVSVRIIALFNPAGAIVQAVELIYRVLSWVFNNAARIFKLVETVVNGAAQLVAGDTSGLAAAIEVALAGLLPTVIDFLAGYFGMGDLPEKIADVIRGFQEYVQGVLRRVIRWLADRGRALLSALGIGGDDDQDSDAGDGDYDGQIGKTVTWSAAGESHRLWIVADGGGVEVLMASGTGNPLQGELSALSDVAREQGDPVESEVEALIQSAQALLSTIVSKSQDLKSDVSDPSVTPEQKKQKDDELEGAEESIKGIIAQIQTKLGVDGRRGTFSPANRALAMERLGQITSASQVNEAMVWLEENNVRTLEQYKHGSESYEAYLNTKSDGDQFDWPLPYIQGRASRRRGIAGESSWIPSGTSPNSRSFRVQQADGTFTSRIPDFIGGGYVGDVKDVQYLSFTAQLRDFYVVGTGRDAGGVPRVVQDSSGTAVGPQGPAGLKIVVRGPRGSERETNVSGPLASAAALEYTILE